MLLLIDNYDSFVYNLARYFEELGKPARVVRNDAIDIDGIRTSAPEALVISPGPCAPAQAGISLAAVRSLAGEIPILGVCLGHQVIGEAFGARVVRGRPVHGRTSRIQHRQVGLFSGVPLPLEAARYHSLVVDPATIPVCLEVSAWTDDGTVMALAHRELPVWGVQFHPESVLTESGHLLLENFLRQAGVGLNARGKSA